MQNRSNDALRVIFAGGGTGGHIMPGAATAEALRDLLPGTECVFLCTERRSETHCHDAIAGFEVVRVPAAQWRGIMQKVMFAGSTVVATERIIKVFRRFRPHVVIGLGGYSCVVALLLARALGIKTMMLESNAIPGQVVRALASHVDCVQLQWQITARHLKTCRILVSGNPVRAQIFNGNRFVARRRFGLMPGRVTLLVMGGSQGAQALNRVAVTAMSLLSARAAQNLQVVHIAGPELAEEVQNSFIPKGINYRSFGFLTQMEDAYSAADFVLSRAGGSSLAELTALGLPSILVPYPYATENHQAANTAVLSSAGAAIGVSQEDLSPQRLASLIQQMVFDPERRAHMAACARALGRPGAARTVALELVQMAGFEAPPASVRDMNDYRDVSDSSLFRAA